MLHTVVIDAEALAALDQLLIITGKLLPRSAVVDRAHGRAWHAIPIEASSIAAIAMLRRSRDEPFNDILRHMLDLAPLGASRITESRTVVSVAVGRRALTPRRPASYSQLTVGRARCGNCALRDRRL